MLWIILLSLVIGIPAAIAVGLVIRHLLQKREEKGDMMSTWQAEATEDLTDEDERLLGKRSKSESGMTTSESTSSSANTTVIPVLAMRRKRRIQKPAGILLITALVFTSGAVAARSVSFDLPQKTTPSPTATPTPKSGKKPTKAAKRRAARAQRRAERAQKRAERAKQHVSFARWWWVPALFALLCFALTVVVARSQPLHVLPRTQVRNKA